MTSPLHAVSMSVINSSQAIHLHESLPGGLADLPDLIGEVVVPFEVCQELAAGVAKDTAWQALQLRAGFRLQKAPVQIHPLLQVQIDAGEAAVIQTALDHGHRAVILDDLKARRLAKVLGLEVTGTLGVLIMAKKAGMLPSIRAAITDLQQRGMWVSPALVAQAIALGGE